MAPSWTVGAGTLLAALGLFSCCSFGWCEASRTSSSISGGDQGASSLERVKRGWVWNQFFVVEEYTGTEPLYVGKVRHLILSNCKARNLFVGLLFTHLKNCLSDRLDRVDAEDPGKCSVEFGHLTRSI